MTSRKRRLVDSPAGPVESWNRLDPATALLEQGTTWNWLLLTDREAQDLVNGYIPPRVRIALTQMLVEILVLPEEQKPESRTA